ncbi:MAG: Rieske 2Fe-2S domain-containing protein [Deltaproteobacteria bacterium]|nr:Rieske 2Fe-2S domain-containing protein [Deltaproteobacteria bacterium]
MDELEAAGFIGFELDEVGPCVLVQLETEAEYGIGPAGSIVAFSMLCPHMGCPLGTSSIDLATGIFGPCGCHQSVFDMRRDGRMIHGRASSNLARVDLEIVDDVICASVVVRPSFGQVLAVDATLPSGADTDEGAA